MFSSFEQEKIKINGIILQQDYGDLVQNNVDAAIVKMERRLTSWSRRHLSTLGKILICKTFAISQIIHVLQSLVLLDCHFKQINNVLYKFIWNRHFQAAKAPERISRMITNTSIKKGGLGMIDVSKLDQSLKLKSVGRCSVSNHPMIKILNDSISTENFFKPSSRINIDPFLVRSLVFVNQDRIAALYDERILQNKKYLSCLANHKIAKLICNLGKQSLGFRLVWNSGARVIKDLNLDKLRLIEKFIPPNLRPHVKWVVEGNYGTLTDLSKEEKLNVFFDKGIAKLYSKSSSKLIREARCENDPLCIFKIGTILTPIESLQWFNEVNKIICVRLKSNLLLTLHGAIYTKLRLFKFGLIESPICSRCHEIETLEHKIIECDYTKRIWKETFQKTNALCPAIEQENDPVKKALAIVPGACSLTISLHSAIISRILQLRNDQNYLQHPKYLVKNEIIKMQKLEKEVVTKQKLNDLLQHD